MAFGANQSLPPYILGPWPWKVRHALVTPAMRWRVFIEEQEPVEHDVILNTVLRIRQAGEPTHRGSRISCNFQNS